MGELFYRQRQQHRQSDVRDDGRARDAHGAHASNPLHSAHHGGVRARDALQRLENQDQALTWHLN